VLRSNGVAARCVACGHGETGVLPEPPHILPPSAKQSPDVSILTAPPPPKPRFSGTRSDVIRVSVGLIGFFGLAYLGGRPFVRALERGLGIAHLITAGCLVLLGAIPSHPSVGILSPLVLYELRPLLVRGRFNQYLTLFSRVYHDGS
jgi:hypothetical protein